MTPGEQGESTWDVEALLSDALQPIEPLISSTLHMSAQTTSLARVV